MEKKYFSTVEVAKILGISREAVLKRIKTGKLRSERLGRNFMIPKTEIDSLTDGILDEQKKKMIRDAVKKIVSEYGEALKLLGKE